MGERNGRVTSSDRSAAVNAAMFMQKMKHILVWLLAMFPLYSRGDSCATARPPLNLQQFYASDRISFSYPVDRIAALKHLGRRDFLLLAESERKSQLKKYSYLIRSLRFVNENSGAYEIYRYERDLYIIYGVLGQGGACEEDVLVIELDFPLRKTFFSVSAAL